MDTLLKLMDITISHSCEKKQKTCKILSFALKNKTPTQSLLNLRIDRIQKDKHIHTYIHEIHT